MFEQFICLTEPSLNDSLNEVRKCVALRCFVLQRVLVQVRVLPRFSAVLAGEEAVVNESSDVRVEWLSE